MKKTKQKNYKMRSKTYKAIGNTTIGATTIGGFATYESIIDWSNFKNDLNNFVVANSNTFKLNLAIAFPLVIAIIVYLIVMLKKNKEYFKDKLSVGLLIAILVTYLIYSVVDTILWSLIGCFVGCLSDEFIFSVLSTNAMEKYEDNKELETEKKKENIRIKARKQSLEEENNLNGSV